MCAGGLSVQRHTPECAHSAPRRARTLHLVGKERRAQLSRRNVPKGLARPPFSKTPVGVLYLGCLVPLCAVIE